MAHREVTEGSDENFIDLTLDLVHRDRDLDGHQHLTARGLHLGQLVSFVVAIGPQWQPQDLEGSEQPLYWGQAELISVGPESDAFVRTLDQLYGTHVSIQFMANRIGYTAVSLSGDPRHLDGGPVRIKLFFEHESEDRYAEFYVNVNVAASIVEFHEKDYDYRRSVVLSLSGSHS